MPNLSRKEQLELVESASHGDWGAFAQLRDAFSEALVGYILKDIWVGRAYADHRALWLDIGPPHARGRTARIAYE